MSPRNLLLKNPFFFPLTTVSTLFSNKIGIRKIVPSSILPSSFHWDMDNRRFIPGLCRDNKETDVGNRSKTLFSDHLLTEMDGWPHWLNGHESEQDPGDGEGQGRLGCYNPWVHKKSRHNLVTEQQPEFYRCFSQDNVTNGSFYFLLLIYLLFLSFEQWASVT